MELSSAKPLVSEGETVIVYVQFGVSYAVTVRRGEVLQMKFGALRHDFMLGQPYGARISASKGHIYILRPTPELWTATLSHRTQILYPADISLVTFLLEAKPGSRLAEAGTGSAALSHALLRTIAPSGHLYTFDIDRGRVEAAERDLTQHGFDEIRQFTASHRNVCEEGFGLDDVVDGVFLDLPQPWDVVEYAKTAMKRTGGRFVSFSPCIEQVQKTCIQLKGSGFTEIVTMECIPREHKVVEQGLDTLIPYNPGQGEENTNRISAVEDVGAPPRGKKRGREDDQDRTHSLYHLPYPWQQPTHTGYLTAATLSPI